MTSELTIRVAEQGDVDTVVAYNDAMCRETEGRGLDLSVLRAGVERAIGDPDRCFYFLADREGVAVGQCMVTFEWTDWRNGWLWWFQSVYVHPDHRRTGVFRALYDHVRTAARAREEVRGLRLYVEKENETAMRTYRELGMVPSGHVVYEEDWSARAVSDL